MSLSTRLAALSLVLVCSCHSAGLVRNATTTPRTAEVEGTHAAVEPYAGGFQLKLALNLPPATIDYSAKREGHVVRIDIREGHYTAKCVDPYDVVLDVGPLEAGDYDVAVWLSSPWVEEDTEIVRTRARVPAGPATVRQVTGTSTFRASACR